MTVLNGIIDKLTQLYSWLIRRQWQREEILIVALVVSSLLLLVLVTRRKARTRIRYIPPRNAPRTTIGIRLAQPAARR
jgi:hypothetical protein